MVFECGYCDLAAPDGEGIFHHEGTKSTKDTEILILNLRFLRAVVVKIIGNAV